MMSLQIAPNESRKPSDEDTLFLMANAKQLAEAGLDLSKLRTSVAHYLYISQAAVGNLHGEMSGDVTVRVAALGNNQDPATDAGQSMLKALDAIKDDELKAIMNVMLASAGLETNALAESEFHELTAAEVAARMRCSTPVVYEREKQGEFFAILAPARVNGRRYPAFQLHDRLDRPLLKRVIEEYRKAGMSANELWNFLRTSQKEFGGKTVMEIMLRATAPALDGLSVQERSGVVMDVVMEELSRTAQ